MKLTNLEKEMTSLMAQLDAGKPLENINLDNYPDFKALMQQVTDELVIVFVTHVVRDILKVPEDIMNDVRVREIAQEAKKRAGIMPRNRAMRNSTCIKQK